MSFVPVRSFLRALLYAPDISRRPRDPSKWGIKVVNQGRQVHEALVVQRPPNASLKAFGETWHRGSPSPAHPAANPSVVSWVLPPATTRCSRWRSSPAATACSASSPITRRGNRTSRRACAGVRREVGGRRAHPRTIGARVEKLGEKNAQQLAPWSRRVILYSVRRASRPADAREVRGAMTERVRLRRPLVVFAVVLAATLGLWWALDAQEAGTRPAP